MRSYAELAYAGYNEMRRRVGLPLLKPWDRLTDAERNCWDAAAQAVLADNWALIDGETP